MVSRFHVALRAIWLVCACLRPASSSSVHTELQPEVPEVRVVDYARSPHLLRGNETVSNWYCTDQSPNNCKVNFQRAGGHDDPFWFVQGELTEEKALHAKETIEALESGALKNCPVQHQFPANLSEDTNLCASHAAADAMWRAASDDLSRTDMFEKISTEEGGSKAGWKAQEPQEHMAALLPGRRWVIKSWLRLHLPERVEALWNYLHRTGPNFPAVTLSYDLTTSQKIKMRQRSPMEGVQSMSADDTGKIVNCFVSHKLGHSDLSTGWSRHAVLVAGVHFDTTGECAQADLNSESARTCKFFVIKDSYGAKRHYHGYFLAGLDFPFISGREIVLDTPAQTALENLQNVTNEVITNPVEVITKSLRSAYFDDYSLHDPKYVQLGAPDGFFYSDLLAQDSH